MINHSMSGQVTLVFPAMSKKTVRPKQILTNMSYNKQNYRFTTTIGTLKKPRKSILKKLFTPNLKPTRLPQYSTNLQRMLKDNILLYKQIVTMENN